jgi:hypothetical protein
VTNIIDVVLGIKLMFSSILCRAFMSICRGMKQFLRVGVARIMPVNLWSELPSIYRNS